MKISISMAFNRKKAIQLIQDQLAPISEHICKIWCHAPSKWDEKWKEDISTFFPKIIKVANNVDFNSGKVPKELLENELKNYFDLIGSDVLTIYNNSKYTIKKSTRDKFLCEKLATEILFPALMEKADEIISLILANQQNSLQLAQLVGKTTIELRNKTFDLN